MKNKLIFLVVCLFAFINVNASKVYLFYGDGCPHCSQAEKAFETLKEKYDFDVTSYEVWYNEENSELLDKVAKKFGDTRYGVPYIVIGNQRISGWNSELSEKFVDLVNMHNKKPTCNMVESVTNDFECEKGIDITDRIKLPFIGYKTPTDVSIGLVAMLIGLVDGFNPCAMWILLFLLSVLINMKSRKKMWALGGAFIVTSGLVYLLIMGAWLKVALKMNEIVLLRNIIAILAVIGGLFNLYNYFKPSPTGCDVTDGSKRKNIMENIRKFCNEKNFWIALIGIIGLAISVNFIELACSAGLPVVFTEILALNNIEGIKYIVYLVIYVLFFLFDDIVIFVIAMLTMKLTGFSNKYARYSHLIGGIIMVIIGLLLIFKPSLIMLNF